MHSNYMEFVNRRFTFVFLNLCCSTINVFILCVIHILMCCYGADSVFKAQSWFIIYCLHYGAEVNVWDQH